MFLVSPPRRTAEVERAFGATKSQTVAVATWTKRGTVAGGTVPRPGRPRLYPACAGQRPMKWASAAGARGGLRGLKATTAGSRKGAKRSKGKSSFSNQERAVLCVLCVLGGEGRCRHAFLTAVRIPPRFPVAGSCRLGRCRPVPWSPVPVPAFTAFADVLSALVKSLTERT